MTPIVNEDEKSILPLFFAERMNGSIQEIKTIGRGYTTAKRFRRACSSGKLDLY